MKKTLILFSLFTSLFVNNDSSAQTKLGCVGAFAPPSDARSVVSCPSTSVAYTARYGRVAGHVPDFNNPPVKVIRISFHFFQTDAGGENFQDNAADNKRIDDIVFWMNFKMGRLLQPSDPIPGVPFQPNSTVQYEVTGRYFYKNSSLNNQSVCGGDAPFRAYVDNIDPSRIATSIPIYVIDGSVCSGTAAGYAVYPSETNLAQDSYVVTNYGNVGPIGDWSFYMHLMHEMGHNLDLDHTYGGDVYKLDPDYLSDVFNVSWSNYCNPPVNYACGHQTGWSLDVDKESDHATNNIMGGTQRAEYLSPLQIGKINRALALKSVRKYVKEMTSTGADWTVSSNETWDFNIQMYSNINITNGATLTITCKVAMANFGAIFVQPGATLIVDGGTITSWGSMWNSIVVKPGGNLIVKNNALIENAQNAILSEAGGKFTVQDSKFNKNYRGFILQAYNGTHLGVIKNTTISCVDASGNPVDLSLSPHVGERAYCAVQLEDVTQATVGVAAAGQTNTFDNLEQGIVNINSGLNVYNNTFKRINYSWITNRGRGIQSTNNSTEKKLIVGGSANAYQKNTFVDSYIGIFASGNQDVDIVSNTFTNLNTGVSITNGSSAGNSVYVLSNTMNDCNTGVYSLDNGGSSWLEVSNNIINPTGVAKPNSKAITLSNSSLSTSVSAPTVNILNNTIKNSSTSIEVINFTGPNLKNNTGEF